MEKNKDGSFTLTEEEMVKINKELDLLECLRLCCVENWDGFRKAMELFNDIHGD